MLDLIREKPKSSLLSFLSFLSSSYQISFNLIVALHKICRKSGSSPTYLCIPFHSAVTAQSDASIRCIWLLLHHCVIASIRYIRDVIQKRLIASLPAHTVLISLFHLSVSALAHVLKGMYVCFFVKLVISKHAQSIYLFIFFFEDTIFQRSLMHLFLIYRRWF